MNGAAQHLRVNPCANRMPRLEKPVSLGKLAHCGMQPV
jgi:hypothetical protein